MNQENITTERKAQLEFKEHLEKILSDSSDRFEKQLSYIAAGALGVSLAFIKDVVGEISKTSWEGFLVVGWILIGATLVSNLLSHIYAHECHAKTISEIERNEYDSNKAACRRRYINYWNYFSIGTLLFGLTSLLIFISINI